MSTYVPSSFRRLHADAGRARASDEAIDAATPAAATTLAIRRLPGTDREVVYVALPSAPHEMLSDAELQRLLGLSPRQASVARLMAARLTSSEIADLLGIRLSTARKHAEIVLMRLGLRKRREVGPLLRELTIEALGA
jgi:DNA-binding CsgD family transcriptional regulator